MRARIQLLLTYAPVTLAARFYGYTALRKVVRQFVKRSKLVLHVGCGNSNFQEGMARDGYQVVNVS